jgi:DNA-binding LytR/AlgR family response regulator
MFFTANRKYIVNINYIKSFRSYDKVKLLLEFSIPDNTHQVIVSQEKAPEFKK